MTCSSPGLAPPGFGSRPSGVLRRWIYISVAIPICHGRPTRSAVLQTRRAAPTAAVYGGKHLSNEVCNGWKSTAIGHDAKRAQLRRWTCCCNPKERVWVNSSLCQRAYSKADKVTRDDRWHAKPTTLGALNLMAPAAINTTLEDHNYLIDMLHPIHSPHAAH